MSTQIPRNMKLHVSFSRLKAELIQKLGREMEVEIDVSYIISLRKKLFFFPER